MPHAGPAAMFRIDPAFESTSLTLGELPLCHVRLQADARFPWIVLIPRVTGAREIEDLPPGDRARLMDEILLAGTAVRAVGDALGRPVEKLNVGALGNVTPQLHVHVVGRRADDPAWPGPVWGFGAAQAYAEADQAAALVMARAALEIRI
ncbi:HIT domain-containing protein [Phenylobacterium sp.]|uniref:HIT domain-containing protein n=1 Tax=Phenylobacterium sp. TaxID=1871053 RepID=UPI003939D9EA